MTLVFMSGIPPFSDGDRNLHLDALHTFLCRSIHASFADFVLLLSFHYETATKAKFIFVPQREWQLNRKSMKTSVVQSSNIIV